MRKFVFFILLAMVLYKPVAAQQATVDNDTTAQHNKSHLRISLLTCSAGEEIWETFGHSCIRIIDSTKTGWERDIVYNYGFVESSPDNTVMHQFLTGRVLVFLDTNTYDRFHYQYVDEKRGVDELVFLLGNEDKESILSFLENNMRRENRYYEYNTFYDNCSTRIYGMFEKIFGNRFVPGEVVPKNSRLTFRDLTEYGYYPEQWQHKYWFALGMDIFYASSSEKIASNTETMFLADYLRDGIAGATIDGKKLCGDKITILDDRITWPATPNEPFIILLIMCMLTIAGLLVKRLRILGMLMSFLVLVLSGIIGCYIIYLWTIDAEPAWKNNFNVLWALPTNLIIPFYGSKLKAKYAVVALSLLIVSLMLDVVRVQEIPLSEITPLLLSLLFIYGMMYRKGTRKTKVA